MIVGRSNGNILESECCKGKVCVCAHVTFVPTLRPSISRPPERKIPKFEGDKQKLKHSKPVTSGIQPKEAGKEQGLQDISIHKTKGDAPDRFWASVEPYCAPITESDLQMLQDGIRSVSTINQDSNINMPIFIFYHKIYSRDDY